MKRDEKLPWYFYLVFAMALAAGFGLFVGTAIMNNAGDIDRKIAPEFRAVYADSYEEILKLEIKRDYHAYAGEDLPEGIQYAYYDITVTAIIDEDGEEKAVQHKYVCCCFYRRVVKIFPVAEDIIVDCDFCRLEVS